MEGMALLMRVAHQNLLNQLVRKLVSCGPLTVLDEIGLKVAYKIRSENKKSLNKRMMDLLMELGIISLIK